MGISIKIFSTIGWILISSVLLFLFGSIIVLIFDMIKEKNILEAILCALFVFPLIITLFILSIYVITNQGFLLVKDQKIIYFGRWFKKNVIRKNEIKKINYVWKKMDQGMYGTSDILNLHIITLGRPTEYLKLGYKFKSQFIIKRLRKKGYKVFGDK